jgi:hypothetical protein
MPSLNSWSHRARRAACAVTLATALAACGDATRPEPAAPAPAVVGSLAWAIDGRLVDSLQVAALAPERVTALEAGTGDRVAVTTGAPLAADTADHFRGPVLVDGERATDDRVASLTADSVATIAWVRGDSARTLHRDADPATGVMVIVTRRTP